jgi:hypothetical protein
LQIAGIPHFPNSLFELALGLAKSSPQPLQMRSPPALPGGLHHNNQSDLPRNSPLRL